MLAIGTGCCGPQVVLVCTSKGQAVNMKTQPVLFYPPSPSNLSFAFPILLFLVHFALRLSLSSFPPERSTSKVLRNVCAQERQHACRNTTLVHDRPERGTREIAVEKKGGRRSERHIADSVEEGVTADHCTASRAEDPGKTTHKLLAGSPNTRNVPSAAIFTYLTLSLSEHFT